MKIDACVPCFKVNTLVGVACVSFLSSELLGVGDDSFKESENMYTFLIDNKGSIPLCMKVVFYSEYVCKNQASITSVTEKNIYIIKIISDKTHSTQTTHTHTHTHVHIYAPTAV